MYLGAMGTYYRDSVARQGYEDIATEVYDRWQEGDQEAAIDAVSNELLEGLAVTGDKETLQEQLQRFDIEGIDAITVHFPDGATKDEITETVAALSPAR
jgi:hypothetical protein